MSRVIKCPICSRTAEMTYRENRVYRSEYFNINCKEVVTVTAPSRVAAEELFSKFEKGTIKPKLSIPKKIAEMLDEELKYADDKLYTFNKCYEDLVLPYELLLQKNYATICAYLAGKELGIELVEVTDE